MLKVTSLKSELFAAQDAAKVADDNWQSELDRQGIERYSSQAKGKEGSVLRHLYHAKNAADYKCHELTETMRRFQDVEQIARP